jgi:glutamate 5-kinase
MHADALVILSDVDAVYTKPPGTPGAERIGQWTGRTTFEEGAGSALGRGGMGSKIAAARLAARAGVPALIASGDARDGLTRLLAGEDLGTLFPAETGLARRKAWLAFATAPAGDIAVNAGARQALVERGASLLPVGVVSVTGDFAAGDVVRITQDGAEIARGVAARDAAQLRAELASGERARPAVHRDHLVIT